MTADWHCNEVKSHLCLNYDRWNPDRASQTPTETKHIYGCEKEREWDVTVKNKKSMELTGPESK